MRASHFLGSMSYLRPCPPLPLPSAELCCRESPSTGRPRTEPLSPGPARLKFPPPISVAPVPYSSPSNPCGNHLESVSQCYPMERIPESFPESTYFSLVPASVLPDVLRYRCLGSECTRPVLSVSGYRIFGYISFVLARSEFITENSST